MQIIGKKFEEQEQQNLGRYINKRLDARAKTNPKFRYQEFLYAQGQPQTQPTQQQKQQQPRAPPVSTVPPSLRKPSVMPQINDEWL
jgi:hypothetical protein